MINFELMGLALVVITVAAFAVGNVKTDLKHKRFDETIGDYVFIFVVAATVLFLILEASNQIR